LYVTSNSLSTGYLVDIQVATTAALNASRALNVVVSGANSNVSQTYGAWIGNNHTGAGSGNTALYVDVSGGTSYNKGILIGGISATGSAGNQAIDVGSTINQAGNSVDVINIQSITGAGVSSTGININSIGGTATTKTGLKVGAVSGAGTNNYSLYLDTVSGATNNYSIYSAGGLNYLAGNIGVGYAPDNINKIYVRSSFDASADQYGIQVRETFTPTSNSSFAGTGIQSQVLKTGTYNLGGLSAVNGKISLDGSGTVGNARAVRGSINLESGSTGGVITSATAISAESPWRDAASNATIGTMIGVNIGNMGNSYVGTAYGLYIGNQTGATTNYSMYSQGGLNYLAGNLGVGVTPSAAASAGYLQVASSATKPQIALGAGTAGYSSTTAGDLWWTGSALNFRTGSSTVDLLNASLNIGSTVGSGTNGSVLFVDSGQLAQDNTNFFWDNTGKDLGIGTNSPNAVLHVRDNAVNFSPSLTAHADAAFVVENANVELAMGTDGSSPYGIWLQARNWDNTAKGIMLNPLGGYVGIGTRNPSNTLTVSTGTDTHGFNVTNGTINLSTYIGTVGSYSGAWIGTETSHPLYFYTDDDSTPSITVTTASRVGIGANTPGSTFAVDQAANATDASDYNDGITLTNQGVLRASLTSDANYTYLQSWNSLPLQINNLGNNIILQATVNGDVGIGTTGPDRILDILDTSGPQMRLTYTDNSVFTDFQTTSGGKLYIAPSGSQVGINTSTMSVALTVAGGNYSAAFPQNVSFYDTTAMATNVGGGLALGGNDGVQSQRDFAIIQGGKENATSGNYDSYFRIFTRQNGNNPAERLRINSAGNVGIGNTNPTSGRLVVQGATASNSANALFVTDSGGSNNLFTVRNDGHIGVGVAPADDTFVYLNHSNDASVNQYGIYSSQYFTPTSNQTTTGRGITSTVRKGGAYNVSRLNAIESTVALQGSGGTLTDAVGVYSSVSLYGSGNAGTITNGAALVASNPYRDAGNTGTITTSYGLRVNNQGDTFVSGNSYGIYLDSQSGATGTSYSIYSAGGLNYLAGNTGIGTVPTSSTARLAVQGTTADNTANALFVTDSGGSNNLFTVRNDGHIGVGGAVSNNAHMYFSHTNTDASVNQYGLQIVENFNPSASQATYQTGLVSSARKTGTYNMGRVIGLSGESILQGTGTVSGAMGVKGIVSLFGAGNGGTITDAYALWAETPYRDASNTGTITNSHGLYVSNQGLSGVTTNSYGIYISNQTGSSSNNYSIYSAGGVNQLAGNLGVGVTTSGGANAAYLQLAGSAARANLNLASSSYASTTTGDLWWTGTALNFRTGSSTVDLLGGSASGWTDGGSVVYSTTNADDITVGGGNTSIAKLGIVGDTDEVQLRVRANATQTTNNLFEVQSSGGTTTYLSVKTSGSTTNKFVGINTATPTSALHVVGTNSIATVGTSNLLTADGTFSGTTGWTNLNGTIWSRTAPFADSANHISGQTGALSGTTSATSNTTLYQINYTVVQSSFMGDAFTITLGGNSSGQIGANFVGVGAHTIYIKGGASGILSFVPGPAGTYVGTIDDVSVYAVSGSTPDIAITSSNGTASQLEIRGGGSAGYNVFVGNEAGTNNVSGNNNSALGYNALNDLTTGTNNTAIGSAALSSLTWGYRNTAIGQGTLSNMAGGYDNTAIGMYAGYNANGSYGNVFIGNNAGYYETGNETFFVDNRTRTNEATSRTSSLLYGQFSGTVANQQLTVNGKLYLRNISTGTGTVLCQDTGTFEVYRSITTACSNPSSIKLKENVANLSGGEVLAKLGQLRPVSFDWKASSGMMGYNGGSSDYGFIAEEVNNIFPNLVTTDSNGEISGLGYIGFVPLIVKGLQEQQNQIDSIVSNLSTLQGSKLNVSGGTIEGSLSIVGGLNTTGPVMFGNLTVNGDSTLNGKLTVNGDIEMQNITINGHIVTAGDTPTAVAGTAAGADSITEVLGNDTSGTLTITTGATGLTSGTLAEVNFAKVFGKNPKVILTPTDANSANLRYFGEGLAEKFKVNITQTPAVNTTYKFSYFIVE